MNAPQAAVAPVASATTAAADNMLDRGLDRGGVGFALLAYGTWGVAPIFWKQVTSVRGPELLAHRTLFSCLAFLVLLVARRRLPLLIETARSPRMLARLTMGGFLVALNWGVFLYSVLTKQLVESSLGYFITPIFNVAAGTLMLRERLTRAQQLAVLLACIGVCILSVHVRGVPWIAVILALSFAAYGYYRKTLGVDALVASNLEIIALVPIALGYLVWLLAHGIGATAHGLTAFEWSWLVACGPFTALPLLWFSIAAVRLPLSTLGFFQYIAPTLQLVIAVMIYHEPFTTTHAQAFSLIWAALGLYTYELQAKSRRSRAPA